MNSEEQLYGGITEMVVNRVMDHLGITDDQVEKVKELISMIEFADDHEGRKLVIKIGDGIEIKIKQ